MTVNAAVPASGWTNRKLLTCMAVLGATVLPAIGSSLLTAAPAAARECADVSLVFARGTFEGPGVGSVGQSFVDELRPKLGDKTLDVVPVNYPASIDFARAADGVADATSQVRDLANACPNTRIVIGGYSQGAAVAAYTTAEAVPQNYTLPEGISGPMPTDIADRVSAVALFGKPSDGFLHMLYREAPPLTVGPLYADKTADLCALGDPVCTEGGGTDQAAHGSYAFNGMTAQAADFTAQRVMAKSPSRR